MDCGADRSCSFGVAGVSSFDGFKFVEVFDDAVLVSELGNGAFFVGRIGVVNCSVEFEFIFLSSIC